MNKQWRIIKLIWNPTCMNLVKDCICFILVTGDNRKYMYWSLPLVPGTELPNPSSFPTWYKHQEHLLFWGLVPDPSSLHTVTKSLGISWVMAVSFVLRRWIVCGLDGSWSPRRSSHDWKLRTFSPTSHSPERGERLERELITDRAYVTKPPLKSPIMWGLDSFWVAEHTEVLGEWRPGRARKLRAHSPTIPRWATRRWATAREPHPAETQPFHLAVRLYPLSHPFITNQWTVSKLFF